MLQVLYLPDAGKDGLFPLPDWDTLYVMKELILISMALVAPLLVDPYIPISYTPDDLGHGCDTYKMEISEIVFTEEAWVSDLDTYQRVVDGVIVKLPNPNTSITATINSGTVLNNPTPNYNGATAENRYTYVIKAKHVDADQVLIFHDYFQATDDQAMLRDPSVPRNECVVSVAGPKGTGGGGN